MLKHVLQFTFASFLVLLLIGGVIIATPPMAHAATSHTVKPASCTGDVTTFQGINNDPTNVYTIALEVHRRDRSNGCVPYYTLTQAFVAEGYSFNIRVCTGEAPESSHQSEVCHDYSGYAPLHGWYSPTFTSYPWSYGGCDGYADIIGHVSITSHVGC